VAVVVVVATPERAVLANRAKVLVVVLVLQTPDSDREVEAVLALRV